MLGFRAPAMVEGAALQSLHHSQRHIANEKLSHAAALSHDSGAGNQAARPGLAACR